MQIGKKLSTEIKGEEDIQITANSLKKKKKEYDIQLGKGAV